MFSKSRCFFILLLVLSLSGTVWSQAQPSVTTTNPVSGATNVMRDVFVPADVFVPNGGIDPATLTSSTVFLYRTSDLQSVPAVLNTSGGGDVIVLRPVSSLAFPSTGTWTNWLISSAPVSLNAGTNTIRLTAIGSSGANIDSLTVR